MQKTFKEWSALGFKIKKGAKAFWTEAGIPVFDETQLDLGGRRFYLDRERREKSLPSSQREDKPPMEDWRDDLTGERHGYRQRFNSREYQHVTFHEDGGETIDCGGPCGPLYVDKFGNT